jgi:D-arabinose 1-dehydrogenase-like Zn-dependent alcohol dehydrogenase
MKAVVLEEFGGPEVLGPPREVPEPTLAAGEALVRVRCCSVCYLDSIVRSGVRPGIRLPLVLGHEIAGEVVELGPHAKGLDVGDRVASTYRAVCGHCIYCRAEQSVHCTNVEGVGVDRDGGYAEYVALPVSGLSRIPEGVADEAATIAGCVLGAVYKAVRDKGRVRPGETVLVTGAGGGAGIHSVQMASLAGARVLASTTTPAKADAIRQAGADDVLMGEPREVVERVKEVTQGRGADVVLDCVGQATASMSLRALARGGRLVFIGELGVEPTRVSVARMLYRETEIYGVASPSGGELAQILSLIATGGLRPLISQTLPLDRAADAHRALGERANIGRITLRVSGGA